MIAFVQARMSSRRFPGKVLYEVGGKPILQYLLERLDRCELLERVVVITSTHKSDEQVADFCLALGIDCFRGSLHNVAKRFVEALEIYETKGFVRVCGDRPLIDPQLVDKGVEMFFDGDFDLVTNVQTPSYPSGQTVEVLNSEVFKRAYAMMHKQDDFEHVTVYFYRNQHEFKIYNFVSLQDYSRIHFSIDTPQDIRNFEGILSLMRQPHWEYGLHELVLLYDTVTSRLNSR